jgi:hypothetical protein
VKAQKTADALWSAEQILRAGSCGALIFWAQYAQASSLRRLHLAAQSSETLFVMVRPLAAAHASSPALLRLALRPSADGLDRRHCETTRSSARRASVNSPSTHTCIAFPTCASFSPYTCRSCRARRSDRRGHLRARKELQSWRKFQSIMRCPWSQRRQSAVHFRALPIRPVRARSSHDFSATLRILKADENG